MHVEENFKVQVEQDLTFFNLWQFLLAFSQILLAQAL